MSPEIALQKREQMIRDGFCVIDNILTDEFCWHFKTNQNNFSLIMCHQNTPDTMGIIYKLQAKTIRSFRNY